MAIYRKIDTRMYLDEKFVGLSPVQPSGQSLWIHLLTGPHTRIIPGLFRASQIRLADDLGWSLEAFREAFREAFAKGMVKADEEANKQSASET